MASHYIYPPPPPPPIAGPQSYPQGGSPIQGFNNSHRGGRGALGGRTSEARGGLRGNGYHISDNFPRTPSSSFNEGGYQASPIGQTYAGHIPVNVYHSAYQYQIPSSVRHQSQVLRQPLRSGGAPYTSHVQPQAYSSFPQVTPAFMGPPIRMGFPPAQASFNLDDNGSRCQSGFNGQSSRWQSDQTHKRSHAEAFRSNEGPNLAAMMTPHLPGKPVGKAASAPKVKKKREHNQLGLTPANEDHESSDEELDEESKLAAAHLVSVESSSHQLQFSHKGRLESLKSPGEIAAWIAERKKRYPTRAKISEATERKAEALKARQKERELRNMEWQKQQEDREKKLQDLEKSARVKCKAAKLQKRLEKAQRQIAEMEAEQAHPIPEDSAQGMENPDDVSTLPVEQPMTPLSVPDTPTLRAASSRAMKHHSPAASSTRVQDEDEIDSLVGSSSETSSDSDTSSDSSDEAPAESSSKKSNASLSLPEPSKRKVTAICRNFLSSGRCPQGSNCRYRHELPTRGSGTRAIQERRPKQQQLAKPERVSLYQKMIAQERQEENEAVLKYIISLGEQGFLDKFKNDISSSKEASRTAPQIVKVVDVDGPRVQKSASLIQEPEVFNEEAKGSNSELIAVGEVPLLVPS